MDGIIIYLIIIINNLIINGEREREIGYMYIIIKDCLSFSSLILFNTTHCNCNLARLKVKSYQHSGYT